MNGAREGLEKVTISDAPSITASLNSPIMEEVTILVNYVNC